MSLPIMMEVRLIGVIPASTSFLFWSKTSAAYTGI